MGQPRRRFDARAHRNAARAKQIDPRFLPRRNQAMTWARVPAAEGGGRIGAVSDSWWVGQIRVMYVTRGRGRVWKAKISLTDGQTFQKGGACQTWEEGQRAGLMWMNDKLLDIAECRHRAHKCRVGPWEYDGTEVRGEVALERPRSSWRVRLFRWLRALWKSVRPFPDRLDVTT